MTPLERHSIRYVLAFIWLVTAAVSLGLYPIEASLDLLAAASLHGNTALAALYLGAILDALLGLATLLFPHRRLWLIHGTVIVAYTLILSVAVPELWLHPFGPLLKNGAVLMLLAMLFRHEESEQ